MPVLLLISAAAGAAPLPKPRGYVSDFAGVLPAPAAAALEDQARALERETGDELAVATVASLDGGTVEDYAQALFKAWGIGKKGKDNGVLILVAPSERKMRIEVGYGLEPVLPDGLAGEIIRESFLPSFKKGDYAGGIAAGTERVTAVLRRGAPAPASARSRSRGKLGPGGLLAMTLFLALFVGIGFFAAGAGAGSKVFFLCLWGVFFGGIPVGMALAAPELAGLPRNALSAMAVLMAWAGWRKAKSNPDAFRGKGKSGGPGPSGWIWGGGGGSSGSGGSSSGGFGGGSSGGGGASGSW